MSQFGMQMPGARPVRRVTPDVYTAMAFVATLALLAAAIVLWINANKIAPGEGAFAWMSLHDENSLRNWNPGR